MASQNSTSQPNSSADIPGIQWQADGDKLIKELLTEMEKKENRVVLAGCQSPTDKIKGETKEKVYRRISEAILPELFKINPKIMSNRIRTKINGLISEYKGYAKRLRKTGEGITSSDTNSYFVHTSGPDQNTNTEIRNIWDHILLEFPHFDRLHYMFGARPNVTPIVVSTGIGPSGPEKHWFQPPNHASRPSFSDDLIDPALLSQKPKTPPRPATIPVPTPSPPSPPPQPSTPMPLTLPTSSTQHVRKPSSVFKNSAHNIQVIPSKRSASEAIFDILRDSYSALFAKTRHEQFQAERQLLCQEFTQGLWTRDEYHEELAKIRAHYEISDDVRPSQRARLSSPPL